MLGEVVLAGMCVCLSTEVLSDTGFFGAVQPENSDPGTGYAIFCSAVKHLPNGRATVGVPWDRIKSCGSKETRVSVGTVFGDCATIDHRNGGIEQ